MLCPVPGAVPRRSPTLATSGWPTRTHAQRREWHLVGRWPFLGNEAQPAV